jgi:DNA-binding winged helix-turn-helix (wHTH) protein/tetratricopeptide (TPR) repeat protein
MPHPNNVCYQFGPYQLDSVKRVLSRSGETIALGPKATDVLIVLVMNAGELVEKDELLKQVWPDTFVEESNLAQNIFMLRRVLGEERIGPKYIETLTRRGYRFVASVSVIGANESQAVGSESNGINASRRPVVAVLPFINSTGNEELEYLPDGFTDNIINNLSRVSRLHVMSRSAVFRFKTKDTDPQQAGRNLGANAVLVGNINIRSGGIVIDAELVDVATGWQLWGESFDSASKDLLEIQAAITRQLLAALNLSLSGEEEKTVTARYTENAEAYQAYLEGRYHWSRYTRKGIEKAIKHFRNAIELDGNYALAYAGIVDCYLRLATNYLPPEDDVAGTASGMAYKRHQAESDPGIKLRFEWDWKGVERELRRANELKTAYPSAPQWYAAYSVSKQLYRESFLGMHSSNHLRMSEKSGSKLSSQIPYVQLTSTEEVQILCSVAREQLAIGNFEAAKLILRRWSAQEKWPRLDTLNPYTAADLLFTLGTLFGCIAGSRKMVHGNRHAEALLNGAVALFEQLGTKSRSVEARVELARCYYRQGLFDLAGETLSTAYVELPDDEMEVKISCLVLWGVVERDSGRLKDSLVKLREARSLELTERLVTNRCYHDLATTLKELAISEHDENYSDEAKLHFQRALYESEVLGHHRFAAAVENNLGFLCLSLQSHEESERHLLRSRRLFEALSDSVRGAQVNETLARLYIETKQYVLAREVIDRAVETFEDTDGEALLAEALTTSGVLAARQRRYSDAKKSFEAAYRVAERCGDSEGAGRALLIMFEEMGDCLEQVERIQIAEKLKQFFTTTQQTGLSLRVEESIAKITDNQESV